MKKITYTPASGTTEPIEPVEIDIVGKTYVAYCPNFYELSKIINGLKDVYTSGVDIDEILVSLFSPSDAAMIGRRLRRGGDVDLVRDLAPALTAVLDHFQPLIEAQAKANQAQVINPK